MTRFQIAPRVPGRPRQIGAVTLSALLALAPMAALAQDSDDGASPPGESTSVSGDGADTAAQGSDAESPTAGAPAETLPATGTAATPNPVATEPAEDDTQSPAPGAPESLPATGAAATPNPVATEPAEDDTQSPAPAPQPDAAATATGTAAPAVDAATPTADAAAPAADAAAPAADDSAPATGTARSATAQMAGPEGEAFGTVTVAETASGQIHLSFTLENLPEGTRAIHIHETGSCEPPGFDSAGGHLTGGRDHGAQAPGGMHAGDMPNITIGADGSYQGEVLTDNVTMDEVLDSDGSAIVIHADADDYISQPAGNAGDRIACGVLDAS
ncbi:Cu/Zn superoxide dismutase [Paracoccus solventivorans]|uniref:Cu/Zn superoxide dismutase n=1 Tax=Paracoccus solventivorans TaxID=53463 RepID=A0A1M7ECN0_9RHOB|nr:superoxide dismutase family protein [Paracoccus solventivorans]SHL89089.1 Cu/Zn superoxide dismutase [Paracoccus solventivorans]